MTRLCSILILAIAPWTSAPASESDVLLGVRWSSESEIRQLASADAVFRYVAPGIALLRGDHQSSQLLESAGLEVHLIDSLPPGESYFITDHLHLPLPAEVTLLYEHVTGWALIRFPDASFDKIQNAIFFLWPLPAEYDSRGLFNPIAAKPLARDPSPAVVDLISQVDPDSLRRHVERLALLDPDLGSVTGNVRTRFAFRPETFESTQYIRDELTRFLGDGAVTLQEFPGRPNKVPSRVGDFDPNEDAISMYNVIGELTGTDEDAGYYIICAHYDAIGTRSRGGWDWRTDVAPGADDNATGVAVVLESARLLSTREFPWSIRFIAWSGEELGLWGSQYYADIARLEEHRILGVLNFDMVGFNDLQDRIELVTNPASEWLVRLLDDTNARYGIGVQVDVLKDRSAGLSDHDPFWVRGFDAILGIENYLPTDSTDAVTDGWYRINSQYHSVADLPDSVNWELVGHVTRLTVAALAQFGHEEDLPNLVVFTGDLRGDPRDNLTIRIGNLGPVPLETPYRVRLWRCDSDSTNCIVFFDQERAGPIQPGGVEDISVEWQRFGEGVFFVDIDPENEIAEIDEEDNSSFQSLRLVPQSEIVVYPNPFAPAADGFLSFNGLPFFSKVFITTLDGQHIWTGAESEQGSLTHEVRWPGINESGFVVGGGLYIYSIRSSTGEQIRRGKIALVR